MLLRKLSTLLIAVGATAPAWAQVSVTFQQGVNGYAGTIDNEFRAANPIDSFGTKEFISVDEFDGGFQTQGTLRFESIFGNQPGQVPEGVTIGFATLSVRVTSASDADAILSFDRVLPGHITDPSNARPPGVLPTDPWGNLDTWFSLGGDLEPDPITGLLDGDPILQDDVEALSTHDSVVSTPTVSGTFVDIDVTSSINAWYNGAPNYGWAINNSTGNGWDFRSAEFGGATATAAQIADRPILTIGYFLTPGDLDFDGDVDPVDYQILLDNLATQLNGPIAQGSGGDLDFDRDVDLDDFAIFKDLYPGGAGGARRRVGGHGKRAGARDRSDGRLCSVWFDGRAAPGDDCVGKTKACFELPRSQRNSNMRTMNTPCLALLAVAVVMTPLTATADDADLSLVINPLSGAASIRNDTGGSVNIDGYLLTSGGSVFNPTSWTTLTGNPSYPNWAKGPAAANRLAEANLFSSLSLAGGSLLSLGSPYLPFTPTAIGQVEPGLKFEYHVSGGASFEGDVVFAPHNNIVLLVNPTTGRASIQNQSSFGVNIDGLLITSTTNALDPIGWAGLAESGTPGWTMGAAQTNRLGEGNLLGSTFLPANGTLRDIGFAVNPAVLDDETDLKFEFHIANVGSLIGGVAFASVAAPAVQGDYNGNGVVDTADYVVWRNSVGSGSLNNRGMGIVGPVGQPDYDFWKSHFGATTGSGSETLVAASAVAVPEPGSGAALILAALSVAAFRFGSARKNSATKARES